MPDERGEFADAARKREAQLAQRLAASVAADEQFETVLRGAVQHNRDSRQRLDAIESEVRTAVATWPGLDTPAGARQFQQFLIGKTREIYKVVADGLADSRARAETVRMLSGRYPIDADRTVHLAGWGRPLSPALDRAIDPSAFEDLLRANNQAVIDAMAQVRAAQKALDDAAAKAYAHGAGSDEAREAMTRLPALKKNLAEALDRVGKIPDYSTIDPSSVHLGPDGAVSFTYTLAGQKMAVTGTLKSGSGEIYDQGADSGSSAYFTYQNGKLVSSRFLDPGRVTPDDALLQNVIFTAVGAGPAVSAGKAGVEAGWQGMRALFAREALEAGGGSASGLTADNVLSRAVTQAEIRAHAAADDLAAHHPGLHSPVTSSGDHIPPAVTHEHVPPASPHVPPPAAEAHPLPPDSPLFDGYHRIEPGPQFIDSTGKLIYPDDVLPSKPYAIPGTVIPDANLIKDTELARFGSEYGGYLAPEGTPFAQLSLPPEGATKPYLRYIVKDPNALPPGWHIEQSQIAPWFHQPGGGTQFRVIRPDGTTGTMLDLERFKVLERRVD